MILIRRALLVAGSANALTSLAARTAPRRRRIHLSAAKDDDATLPGATFEVLHEDDDILVVDKGAGLLFVPGRQPHKADSLISRLRVMYGDGVGVPHRLDRDTSGVCVFSKTQAALRALSMAFQNREVHKTYMGAVAGVPEAYGVIDGAIGKLMTAEGHNRMALVDEAEGGRAATTAYRLLDAGEDSALLALEPKTGRAHQLRLHLASLGHPLIGDALHGGRAHERLCLHCSRLIFEHPTSKKAVDFTSAAPFDAAGAPAAGAVETPAEDAAAHITGASALAETHADYASLTVPALKALLRERGLKVGGTKGELVARLAEA